jgi:hypothetical protein
MQDIVDFERSTAFCILQGLGTQSGSLWQSVVGSSTPFLCANFACLFLQFSLCHLLALPARIATPNPFQKKAHSSALSTPT